MLIGLQPTATSAVLLAADERGLRQLVRLCLPAKPRQQSSPSSKGPSEDYYKERELDKSAHTPPLRFCLPGHLLRLRLLLRILQFALLVLVLCFVPTCLGMSACIHHLR